MKLILITLGIVSLAFVINGNPAEAAKPTEEKEAAKPAEEKEAAKPVEEKEADIDAPEPAVEGDCGDAEKTKMCDLCGQINRNKYWTTNCCKQDKTGKDYKYCASLMKHNVYKN